MFKWLRRKPPEPYSQEYGAVYNPRKHRWELCHPDAQIVGLFRVTAPTSFAQRQGDLYNEYDAFTHALKHKVDYEKWLRLQDMDASLPHVQETE